MMTAEKKNWSIAFGYVSLIYATLEFVPLPAQFLRRHGLLRPSLYTLFAFCVIALFRHLRRNRAPYKHFGGLTIIMALYVLTAHFVGTPEEQIHFLEYGFVGVLFARALTSRRALTTEIFVQALGLSIAVGWIDEIIQGLLPRRFYDIHDVILNAVSALLGLAIYSILQQAHLQNNKHAVK